MVARITVSQERRGDWSTLCDEHGYEVVSSDWALAYEAAVGHACMAHPAPACEHDTTYVIGGRFSERKCLWCGAAA